jgi:hypothetical protein
MRAKYEELSKNSEQVQAVLEKGGELAQNRAGAKMAEVRQKIGVA